MLIPLIPLVMYVTYVTYVTYVLMGLAIAAHLAELLPAAGCWTRPGSPPGLLAGALGPPADGRVGRRASILALAYAPVFHMALTLLKQP
ncbi:hypothetical protein [Streptomyces sp. NPDC058297]|uniref:hypothetical protein n=1 Tax=Streptomyces sp. NPDC058297 TaxID=3346433 RepID=UPI0036EF9B36